jgi:hypothetical protein
VPLVGLCLVPFIVETPPAATLAAYEAGDLEAEG